MKVTSGGHVHAVTCSDMFDEYILSLFRVITYFIYLSALSQLLQFIAVYNYHKLHAVV